jgi:hypothetical protein
MDAGQLFIGICNALMTFGVVFANAGIFTREQLADECARSIQQIRTQRAAQGEPPISQAREHCVEQSASGVFSNSHGRRSRPCWAGVD